MTPDSAIDPAPGSHVLAPLRECDESTAAKIREGLLARGYSGEAMRELVPETADGVAGMQMDFEEIGHRIGMGTAQTCLLRAFLLRVPTPEDVMRRMAGEEFFGLCESAGLWTRVDSGVVGSVVFFEDGGTFVLSDHTTLREGETAMHWVMSVGTSTMLVADSTERRAYGRVLDLCCGSGALAAFLAPHAGHVVAIERNPRALHYARFGAAMNGHGNIEFRETDRYSAVAGEQFDLILCNPPYVMTPDRAAYYRDGGMGGDRFSEQILRDAAGYLAPSGVAHFTCDVASMGGRSSEERLREWVAGNGCDVIALAGAKMAPEAYAESWLQVEARPREEADRWVAYFRELGVEEIQNWLVVMRRRAAGKRNWFLRESLPARVKGYFGHQIARLFRCQDLLRMSDEAVWKSKLRLAPDVRLHYRLRPEGGRWMGDSARLVFSEGLTGEFEVGPESAGMLLHIERERTTELALQRIAAEMKSEPEDVREGFLELLRHMLENGVLEPA